jgi:ABC-type lipoprotein release transport system permease subunit
MNTILMSVMERSREFGIMIALGMAPAQVTAMVLVESFWIGICGLLLGVVITTPWFVYMSKVGLDFSTHIGTDYSAGGVLVDPVVRFRLYGENALIIMVAVLALTLLAGLYPAVRAGRLPPVESMKQD